MGYILEQCCPDDRVGFKASRGDVDPCVFYLKNGPPILIMVPEIASGTFESGGDRPESGGVFIRSEAAISSRVGSIRNQMVTVRAVTLPSAVNSLMTKIPELWAILLPNE